MEFLLRTLLGRENGCCGMQFCLSVRGLQLQCSMIVASYLSVVQDIDDVKMVVNKTGFVNELLRAFRRYCALRKSLRNCSSQRQVAL